MQMQTPQRPHPINKKGEVKESYDQGDCYDDLLTKNTRELTIEFDNSSIDLSDGKEQEILAINSDSIDDIDIEAIEAKVLKKPKQD
jgi:archaellum component FlaG (FlaF/FlaG flagellin family)